MKKALIQFLAIVVLLCSTVIHSQSADLNVDGGSTYDLSSGSISYGDEYIGYSGIGTFKHTGGANTVTEYLYLGYESSGSGTYELSGDGSLSANNEYIGYRGTGTFNQTGGTNTVSDNVIIANIYTTGTYNLSGDGSFSANTLKVGVRGNGTFNQSSGTNSSSSITLGAALGKGTYNLSGGRLSANQETIGALNTGTFTQTGGINTVTYLKLGYRYGINDNPGNGTYDLSGDGSLKAVNVTIGDDAIGTFNQSSGTNEVTNDLFLGVEAGTSFTSNGTYELSANGSLSALNEYIGVKGTGTFNQIGGTNTVTNDLFLGVEAGTYYTGNGTYTLSGGTLDVGGGIVNGTGTSTLNIDGGTLRAGYIDVGANDSFSFTSGTLELTNSELVIGTEGLLGNTVTLVDGMNITADIANGDGSGALKINGGTLNSDSVNVDYLYVGSGNATGSHSMSSGTFTAHSETIGYNGTGTFTQTGGTNTVSTILYVGWDTGTGTYDLSGGTLSAGAIDVGVNGSLNFTSGTLDLTNSDLYIEAGGLLGDSVSLADGKNLSAVDQIIGYAGSGSIDQTGGSNTADADLVLGYRESGSGDYELGSGTLATSRSIAGLYGTGTFTQTGGTHNASSRVYVGYYDGSDGTYELIDGSLLTASATVGLHGTGTFNQSGGTNTITNGLYLGANAGEGYTSSGTYTLSGGTLNAGYIANGEGHGVLKINGGTLNSNSVDVDYLYVGSGSATGSHTMSSGIFTAHSETIGYTGNGTFNQDGGTNTVNYLDLASMSGSSGEYNLSGGTLDVKDITFGDGTGEFNFDGGRLEVDNFYGDLTNNGGTLAPGASPGTTTIAGDYTQAATGALEIELGGYDQGVTYDLLQVNGTATLDGLLTILLYDGFVPNDGDYFDILTADAIVGEFASYTLPTFNGYSFDVAYLTDYYDTTDVVQLQVSVVPEPISSTLFLIGGGLMGFRRFRKI